jgi:hypothetical protein
MCAWHIDLTGLERMVIYLSLGSGASKALSGFLGASN